MLGMVGMLIRHTSSMRRSQGPMPLPRIREYEAPGGHVKSAWPLLGLCHWLTSAARVPRDSCTDGTSWLSVPTHADRSAAPDHVRFRPEADLAHARRLTEGPSCRKAGVNEPLLSRKGSPQAGINIAEVTLIDLTGKLTQLTRLAGISEVCNGFSARCLPNHSPDQTCLQFTSSSTRMYF